MPILGMRFEVPLNKGTQNYYNLYNITYILI
jgi:hypothetical protein